MLKKRSLMQHDILKPVQSKDLNTTAKPGLLVCFNFYCGQRNFGQTLVNCGYTSPLFIKFIKFEAQSLYSFFFNSVSACYFIQLVSTKAQKAARKV